jgi:hypothetical protein
MRGFDTDRGNLGLMEGFRVHYNLVKTHQVLGTIPGEAAGIPLPSEMRWKAIVQKAARSRIVTRSAGAESKLVKDPTT